MTYRTLAQWNARDRIIKRGEKSHARDKNGICLFSKKQTKKKDEFVNVSYQGSNYHRPTRGRRGIIHQHDYDTDDPLAYLDPLNQ